MTNNDKLELTSYCKKGLSFKEIKELMYCSDTTIKRYMKVFSPKKEATK